MKQSDNVFKESVSLHSEQIGMANTVWVYVCEKEPSQVVIDGCRLLLAEVESEVVDKQKYIVETKETMEKNSVRLAELAETIGEIHTGETLGPVSESVSDKFKRRPQVSASLTCEQRKRATFIIPLIRASRCSFTFFSICICRQNTVASEAYRESG